MPSSPKQLPKSASSTNKQWHSNTETLYTNSSQFERNEYSTFLARPDQSTEISNTTSFAEPGLADSETCYLPFTSTSISPLIPDECIMIKANQVEVPLNTSPAEVERLRAAMDAQLQLSQQREKLVGQGNRNDQKIIGHSIDEIKTRKSSIDMHTQSPAFEETFKSPMLSGLNTASTDSTNKSSRVEASTPKALAPQTPSYPFPQMRTSGLSNFGNLGHRQFTALSPTVNYTKQRIGSNKPGTYDTFISSNATPVSEIPFRPTGAPSAKDDAIFETPNLYDLSLMLSSEPGLEPWWATLVEILKNIYGAQRATLSIPADSTDIENVPWGQKATFNMMLRDDELNSTLLAQRSSYISGNLDANENPPSEDLNSKEDLGLHKSENNQASPNRNIFNTNEEAHCETNQNSEVNENPSSRPNAIPRTKRHLTARADAPPRTRTLENARLNLKSLEDHLVTEATQPSKSIDSTEPVSNRDEIGHVFSVLQALDHEVDPLIDNKGISRVLQRGNVIALTRDYPYVDSSNEKSTRRKSYRNSRSKCSGNDKVKTRTSDNGSRTSSFFGHRQSKSSRAGSLAPTGDTCTHLYDILRSDCDIEPGLEPKYDEYEQAPASPWSQSPAPSPAVHNETSDSLFFADMQAVEETFNPKGTPLDYGEVPQPETIGADRSWTVLHVPLLHPLLSRPVQSFRLDAAALESKSAETARGYLANDISDDRRPSFQEKNTSKTPIAILSLLTPLIPYPSNLRTSLEHLAPHLATTFSLCRQFSNLETEISGLSRKRPQTTGFGAVIPGTLRLHTEDQLNIAPYFCTSIYDSIHLRSTGGSLTSPSDYSGLSKSNTGSPLETPGWDPGNSSYSQEKRSSIGSPGFFAAESYFTNRIRSGIGKADISRIDAGSNCKNFNGPKDTSVPDTKVKIQRGSRDTDGRPSDLDVSNSHLEQSNREQVAQDSSNFNEQETRNYQTKDLNISILDGRDPSSCLQQTDNIPLKRPNLRTASHQTQSRVDRPPSMHTLLHSYGADFGSTFQPLPSTSRSRSSAKLRAYSCSGPLIEPSSTIHMPPPSDRVKSILLDSLPLHLFIAMPPTGEIVWVNSRYLTYRGQSLEHLHENPWDSIHPAEREEYLKSWKHSLRTGEQFAMQARLKRFDGTYRWFYTRASGLRDSRGVVVQWHGTSMDIHEQHVAEVKAARQEEIEASEAKHRRLANLIPQIIFSATEEDGITFANHQWLSFTGQPFEDSIGLGFIDFVHPEDIAKCHVLIKESPLLSQSASKISPDKSRITSPVEIRGKSRTRSVDLRGCENMSKNKIKSKHNSVSRTSSFCSTSLYDYSSPDIAELTRTGVVKLEKDSNGQLSYSTEVRLRSKTGEYRWHLVRCVEVEDIKLGTRDGSWFGACADINDQKLLEMKLKEAMESKSKFLSNMSHEIRTPLIGISGMVGFLQDTVLNEEQLDYCNTISSSAQGLLAIINDILDLAKADAGMIKLVHVWFHVRSLVEEVNETLSTMAITKHLEVNYVVDVDVPEMVKGDRFRIRQALLNVIGNAIKFTTVGEVFTRCKIAPGRNQEYELNDNEVMLEFSITDTGKGFTQEEAEIIFKPFSQIDSSSTRSQGGTGLGLVISRQLVELHGGKMEGTAIPGKGSTFRFTAVFGLPTIEDFPESPATSKTNSSPSCIPSHNFVCNSISNKVIAKNSNDIVYTKNLMSSPAEDSLKSSSSIGSFNNYSSDSLTTSVRSEKSPLTSSSPNLSVTLSPSDCGKTIPPGALNFPALKLDIPSCQSLVTTIKRSPSQKNIFKECLKSNMTDSFRENKEKIKQPCQSMYSILLICPQMHSREATMQHIEMTLPKDVPHQITEISSVEEAYAMIGANTVLFTHIVINLGLTDEIINLIDQILESPHAATSIVILSDPLQRQKIVKCASNHDYSQLAKQNRIIFIFKPVKPSRFAIIFDPQKERDLSTDRNRSSAEQQVATQRQNYLDIGKRLGNKGLRVLLVEDNPTNQKVLLKYLAKVRIAVDLANDGLECTEKVFNNQHSFYSLILCDLQMPNKDGYQACREIRQWENENHYKQMPIVALSANVMTDVVDRCNEAGFSNYITKPVDFKALSRIMGDYLDPDGSVTSGNHD